MFQMATRAELSPRSQSLMSMQWLKRPLEDEPTEIRVTSSPGKGTFQLQPADLRDKSFSITLTRNPKEAGPYDSVYHVFTGAMESSFQLQSMEGTLDNEVNVRQGSSTTEFFVFTVGESSGDPMVLSTVKPS